MIFQLPKFTELQDGATLFPLLSLEAYEYHYGRHHKNYVDKMNALLPGSGLEKASLEEIVQLSEGSLYNNATQAWNHTFYWLGLMPTEDSNHLENHRSLYDEIRKSFGSYQGWAEEFSETANQLFGSGWVWFIQDRETKQLRIVGTKDAGNPIRSHHKPLLVCDVWEHAYYIDFRNVRSKYIESFLEKINWEFVEKNLHRNSIFSVTSLMKGKEYEKTPLE